MACQPHSGLGTCVFLGYRGVGQPVPQISQMIELCKDAEVEMEGAGSFWTSSDGLVPALSPRYGWFVGDGGGC